MITHAFVGSSGFRHPNFAAKPAIPVFCGSACVMSSESCSQDCSGLREHVNHIKLHVGYVSWSNLQYLAWCINPWSAYPWLWKDLLVYAHTVGSSNVSHVLCIQLTLMHDAEISFSLSRLVRTSLLKTLFPDYYLVILWGQMASFWFSWRSFQRKTIY